MGLSNRSNQLQTHNRNFSERNVVRLPFLNDIRKDDDQRLRLAWIRGIHVFLQCAIDHHVACLVVLHFAAFPLRVMLACDDVPESDHRVAVNGALGAGWELQSDEPVFVAGQNGDRG